MIWGTTITPGNEYALVFKEELHLSLATLESRDEYGSASGSPCHLILTTKRANYLLCTLLNRVVYQQALDLTLMPNEKVTFKCQGETKIHLTGYTKKESIYNGRKGSLDDRVQRSADAALGEYAAEDTSISDVPAEENTCVVVVEKDVTTMAEDVEDCSDGREIAILYGYHGNEIVVQNTNEDNDVFPVLLQGDSDEEREPIRSNGCDDTEAFIKDTEGQEENILVKALRDCIIGKGKMISSCHGERTLANSTTLDASKGPPENIAGATLYEVSDRGVLHQIGSDKWKFLTGKGIKTEEEERDDIDSYQQKDAGTDERSQSQSVEDHNGLNDSNSGLLTRNERHGARLVITEANCKGDCDSVIASVLDSTEHAIGVIESVKNGTPGGSGMDPVVDDKGNSGNIMKLSGDGKIQGTSIVTSVTDGKEPGGNSVMSLGNGKGHRDSGVILGTDGVEHDKVHDGIIDGKCVDSFPACENKNGKISSLQNSKTDLENQLKKLKEELSEKQSSFDTNLVIDECLDIVRNMAQSDAGDSTFLRTRAERTMASSDELTDLELVDLLPSIDDIIIKEEIDLDDVKGLEDMDISFLNAFHGNSISEAHDLILKKEDLNFQGLLDDCGQCLDGGFCTVNDLFRKTEPFDFKLEVSNLHPDVQRLAQSGKREVTDDATPRSRPDSESSLTGEFAQSSSMQDVFTSKVRNLKVTLSRQEVRKAMSDQVVKKEDDDADSHVPTEDEADVSRSEVSDTTSSEDETDWEAIVESRSERDTKKRKSKTKAKEVTAKLLKEFGDVLESDDENQGKLPGDRADSNQEDETDNGGGNDFQCAEGDVQTAPGKHSIGKRKLKSKFTKKRKKYRIDKLLISESSSNINHEKYNQRKKHSNYQEETQAPQKKKFCLPVKLSLMQNVKTPRHRRRVNHTRLKCRYCSKSYLYTGSLRRHESTHWEYQRSSIQGTACGDSHRKLNQHKLWPSIQPSKKPFKCHFSKEKLDTPKGGNMHDAKHKNTKYPCLNSGNVPLDTDTQKQLDIHYKGNDKLTSFSNVNSLKESDTFTTQEKANNPPRPFKCKFCPKKFIHEGSLKSHEMSHDEKPFRGTSCEEGFARHDQLEQHQILKNGEKMPFTCFICQTCFASDSDCDIHFQKSHANSKISADKNSEIAKFDKLTSKNVLPHTCKSCGKGFQLRSVLKKHEVVHKGKKPFNCRHCKKAFRMLENCRRHEGKHTRENSLKSQSGDLTFKQAANRKMIPQLTPIVRPFKCEYCSKTFSLMAVRNSHEKEHAGQKMNFSQFSNKNASQLSNKNIGQYGSKIASVKGSQNRKYSL